MTLIYFLLLLTVIICIHELGHLIAAKIFGVYCYEFSFGMGPVLFKKKSKETTYSIRALPIGGFVAMAGEADGDEVYPDVVVPEGRRITEQKTWKKIIIMLAGVFMNFFLALILFSLIYLKVGYYQISPKPIVEAVKADFPAEIAGVQAGDVIKSVTNEEGNQIEPETYYELSVFLSSSQNETLTYEVIRGDELITLEITPKYDEESGRYLIGIEGPQPTLVKLNFLNCWKYGMIEMLSMITMMMQTIRQLFTGNHFKDLSGPVGIYNITQQSVSLGLRYYLFLIAELSVNVGIFNLLPLPVLDGGQVVMACAEGIIGKPLNQKLKLGIMLACWVLLITVMVYVTWQDIGRLLTR